MKSYFLIGAFLLIGAVANGQNYNDLFTTYKNTNAQQNNGVAQYQTIDSNQFCPFLKEVDSVC